MQKNEKNFEKMKKVVRKNICRTNNICIHIVAPYVYVLLYRCSLIRKNALFEKRKNAKKIMKEVEKIQSIMRITIDTKSVLIHILNYCSSTSATNQNPKKGTFV